MGRAIVIGGVIIILALVAVAWGVYRSRHAARREDIRAGRATRGDLNRAQEAQLRQLVDDAASVMRSLGVGDPLAGEVDFITPKSRRAVSVWLQEYTDKKRSITRA